ncbi:hypothetical protein [Mesorhizobium carmichaelinearum]|uniref:hypothetical protein n=1 Tax=Mesorhizobium carmichaelinearum TaxID=1208188 RepID=UPI00117F3DFD|nr:hypothetical protein [Mesorhizobium carmichaelinearum]
MPNTTVRAAAEGMPDVNRRRLLLGLAAASTAAVALAVAPHAHATSDQPSSKLPGLEAAFYLEWNKLRAMEPDHAAAERRYFEERAKLVKPVMREHTAAELEAWRKITVAEMPEWRFPGRLEFDEAIRAYNKAEWAIRRRTGFTKIDRAYQGQHGRVSAAADRVIRCRAHTFEDLAAKARVHRVWEFDGSDLDWVMGDIARIARKGGLPVS